jgi:hypothetical protein
MALWEDGMNVIEQFKAVRRVNTPLVIGITADQPALQAGIATALNGSAVLFAWDAVRGLRPANDQATMWAEQFLGVADAKPQDKEAALRNLAAQTGAPFAALDFAQNLPERAVLFMLNVDKWVADPVVATGILNLRETFKRNKRTFIGTAAEINLPADLQSSVVLIEDEMPTDEERGAIIDKLYEGAKTPFPALTPEERAEAITATRGLSYFMAEQTYAMSLEKDKGVNVAEVWRRKRIAFNQIDGLTLEDNENAPTFDDIRGLEQILKRERAHFAGKGAAAVIVRIEEIEKALAGSQGDSSGTGQAALGYILDFMQENRCTGFVALGPGGSGKSLVSKALGRQFHRPVVLFDVKATEDKFVGESGRKIRNSLRAIKGLAGGKPILFVATCNKLDALPPELKRRFKQGLWFFDLPTVEERAAIWKLYLGKFGLKGYDANDLAARFVNWTGAEIFNACETASDEGISIDDAAEFVVPVAEADPTGLAKLRDLANERFLNASAPGKYIRPGYKPTTSTEAEGDRAIDLSE